MRRAGKTKNTSEELELNVALVDKEGDGEQPEDHAVQWAAGTSSLFGENIASTTKPCAMD